MSRTQQGRTLDTSGFFNQDNYRGKIREVRLGQFYDIFPTLEGALAKYRSDMGDFVAKLAILNRVYGSTLKNEPIEAILLSDLYSLPSQTRTISESEVTPHIRGIIIQPVQHFILYPESQFRFVL